MTPEYAFPIAIPATIVLAWLMRWFRTARLVGLAILLCVFIVPLTEGIAAASGNKLGFFDSQMGFTAYMVGFGCVLSLLISTWFFSRINRV
jgi:hypothetical protein